MEEFSMWLLHWLAAWVPTDGALALARVIREAIDATMTRAEASACMRLDNEALLSEQLNCQKPLNLFRLGEMPTTFWEAFETKLALVHEGVYLTPGTVLILRGAAALNGNTHLHVESRQVI